MVYWFLGGPPGRKTPEVKMEKVEIDEVLATKLITALSLAGESIDNAEASQLLEQLSREVGDARSAAHKAEAELAAQRAASIAQARRLAKAAVSNFDQVSDMMISWLTQGGGLNEHQLSNLLRAQAQYKLYTMISTAVEDDSVLEMIRYTLRQAKQTLAGGRKSTDAVDRAVMEYDRDAAARFVEDWSELA